MSLFGDYVRSANSIAQSRLQTAEQLAQSRGSMYQAAGGQAAEQDQAAGETADLDSIRTFADKYGLKTGGKAGLQVLQYGAENLGAGVARAGRILDAATEGADYLRKAALTRIGPKPPIQMSEISAEDFEGGGDVPSAAVDKSVNPSTRAPAAEEDGGGYDEEDLADFQELMAQKGRIYGPRAGQEPIEESAGIGRGEVQPEFDPERAADRLEQETENIKGLKPEDTFPTDSAERADVEDVTDSAADVAGDAADVAEKTAIKTAEDTAEEVGKSTLSDLAGEAGGRLAGVIGEAIPIIGLAADVYTAVSTGMDIAKMNKEDPFGQANQAIQRANTQIGAMEAQVSTDQFQQRIGAAMPSFGSLAAAGQRAGQSVALHD